MENGDDDNVGAGIGCLKSLLARSLLVLRRSSCIDRACSGENQIWNVRSSAECYEKRKTESTLPIKAKSSFA